MEGRDILKHGIIKRVGNGQTTRIWEDNWISRDEMLRPYGCRVADPPVMVADLIDATTATWNRQLVQQVFMPMDAEIILSIPPCTRNMADFWSWHFERHGNFSVKTAYNMLVATKLRREAWLHEEAGSSSSNAEQQSWKFLWKRLYRER